MLLTRQYWVKLNLELNFSVLESDPEQSAPSTPFQTQPRHTGSVCLGPDRWGFLGWCRGTLRLSLVHGQFRFSHGPDTLVKRVWVGPMGTSIDEEKTGLPYENEIWKLTLFLENWIRTIPTLKTERIHCFESELKESWLKLNLNWKNELCFEKIDEFLKKLTQFM